MKEITTVKDYLNWYKKDTIILSDYSYHTLKTGLYKEGVYFLLYKDVVVYVGMSTYCIEQRIEKHMYNKKFNLVKYIPISRFRPYKEWKEQIRLAEYVFINIFNPFYNKQSKHNEYHSFLNLNYKMEKRQIHFELNSKSIL